jgi:hypothetical protein
MRYVVAVVSPTNVEKCHNYLASCNKIVSSNNVVILVGLDAMLDSAIRMAYPNVEFRSLPNRSVYCNYNLHYGGFLDAIPEAKMSALFIVVDPTNRTVQIDIPNSTWETIRRYAMLKTIQIDSSFERSIPSVEDYVKKAKIKNWLTPTITRTYKYYDFNVVAGRKAMFLTLKEQYENGCHTLYERTNSKYAHNILLSCIVKTSRIRVSYVPNTLSNPPEKEPLYYFNNNGIVKHYESTVVFALPIKEKEKEKPKPEKANVTVQPIPTTNTARVYNALFTDYIMPVTNPSSQYDNPSWAGTVTNPLRGCNCATCNSLRRQNREEVL